MRVPVQFTFFYIKSKYNKNNEKKQNFKEHLECGNPYFNIKCYQPTERVKINCHTSDDINCG